MKTYVAFVLSMPSANTWNGKWSGAERSYVRVHAFGKRPEFVGKSFTYSFGDGWVAGVRTWEVTAKQGRDLIKSSAGFCGYDWMIDSIERHGEIRA